MATFKVPSWPECRPVGEVDATSSRRFLDELLGCVDASPHGPVVVDCSELEYVGAAGIRALLQADRYARTHGRRLVLVGVPPSLCKIVDVAGIAHVSL